MDDDTIISFLHPPSHGCIQCWLINAEYKLGLSLPFFSVNFSSVQCQEKKMIYKQTRYLALACLVLGKERLLTAHSALFRTGGIPESHTWLGKDKARLSMTPSGTVVLWHRAGCVPCPCNVPLHCSLADPSHPSSPRHRTGWMIK